MTDKIITTFETTIMWFDPMDKLPKRYSKIFIYFKNFESYEIKIIEFYGIKYKPWDIKNEDKCFWYGNDDSDYISLSKIKYWAYLLEFDQ